MGLLTIITDSQAPIYKETTNLGPVSVLFLPKKVNPSKNTKRGTVRSRSMSTKRSPTHNP